MNMNEYSVHYIACFYFGNRQNSTYSKKIGEDPYFFIKKHLNFLKSCTNNIKSATFVFNVDSEHSGNLVRNFTLFGIQDLSIKLDFFVRNNSGFSYGAWSESIERKLDDDIDYFILLEDDYLPTCENFYIPFVEKCTDETPYVCCKVINSCKESSLPHASISNGLISKNICKLVYQKYGKVFNINNGNTYNSAYQNQLFFYSFFQTLGYRMCDILENYSVPFMISDTNKIQLFGDSLKSSLISPIEV